MKRLAILVLLLFAAAQPAQAAFAFVQKASTAVASASATTITVALTGVGAGNLIVLWVRHEGAATTVTASDGTSSFTSGTYVTNGNNDFNAVLLYLLVANSGNITYTATFSSARAYRGITVFEYSYTGTASFDVQDTGTGNSTAPASANITTTGTDEAVFGGITAYNFSARTISSPLLNAVAPDQTQASNAGIMMFSKVFTSTFTGNASGTLSASDPWICNVIAFKASAGAAPAVPKRPPVISGGADAPGAMSLNVRVIL